MALNNGFNHVAFQPLRLLWSYILPVWSHDIAPTAAHFELDRDIKIDRCVAVDFGPCRHSGNDFMQQAGHAGRVQCDFRFTSRICR